VKIDEIGISVVDLGTARTPSPDLVALEGIGTGELDARKTEALEVGNHFTTHYNIYGSNL
jgi:hypothetical protein